MAGNFVIMSLAWLKWRPLITIWTAFALVLSNVGMFAGSISPAVAAPDESSVSDDGGFIHQGPIALMVPPHPALPPGSEPEDGQSSETTTPAREHVKPDEGLDFTLSDGKPEIQPAETANNVVNAQILSEEETTKLLKLLPPLVEDKLPAFLLPVHSIPPPTSLHRINEPFPPHERKPAAARPVVPALRVTSKRPIGAIDHSNNVSITFSQPMVPVASQASIAAQAPPVVLRPAVPGEWKWYGTQTLTFESKDKQLPMATMYTIKIPEGTTAVAGSKLLASESWTFSTAPARMLGHYPDAGFASVRPTTLIMARFNQRVDKDLILKLTKINAAGKTFSAIPAKDEEIAADAALSRRLRSIPAGMAVVFKSSQLLPSDSNITVSIGPKINSAEGPLVENKTATFSFRTYGPFTIRPQPAQSRQVTPGSSFGSTFEIAFSNALSNVPGKTVIDKKIVTVTPAIPDYSVSGDGSVLYIDGTKKPNTTYHVQINDKLVDEFGQHLSGKNSLDFYVGHATKQLFMPTNLTVLSSRNKPRFSVSTVNLTSVQIKIYPCFASQYVSYSRDQNEFLKHQKPIIKKLRIKDLPDQPVVTEIDLSPYLDEGRGNLVISIDTQQFADVYESNRSCWVQCTNLGLDAFADSHTLKTWVTDLESGAPIKDAKVTLLDDQPGADARGNSARAVAPDHCSALTDNTGLANIKMKKKQNSNAQVVIATRGKDTGFVGQGYQWLNTNVQNSRLDWYIITDRAPYRPGETVNAKGIIRDRLNTPGANLSIAENIHSVKYVVTDSRGNELTKGQTDSNQFGSFDLSFKLPQNVNLGFVNLTLTAVNPGNIDFPSFNSSIKVAEFRRPDFELKVHNDGESVHVINSSTVLSASTNYYAGGSLTHSPITWTAVSNATTYDPPGWDEFAFGRRHFSAFRAFGEIPQTGLSIPQALKGQTDGSGKHYLKIDFLGVHPAEPSTLNVSATVQDVNRQTWTDSTTLLVHPSTLYVGTHFKKAFIKKGERLPLSLIVTNIEGKAKSATPIKLQLWRSMTQFVDGQSKEQKDDIQSLSTVSGAKPVDLDLQPNLSGCYNLLATVTDESGHPNETLSSFWVEGGDIRAEADANAAFKLQKVLLIPEKTEYKPGDEATILVQSPFGPAEGLATVWHSGLANTIPFRMSESSYRLRIPITEQDMPAMLVQVDLVGVDKKSTIYKAAPAEATNSVNFKVSTDSRKLSIEAKPDVENAEPGKEISISLDVTDQNGTRVPDSEVAVAVVDDALLSLANYRFQNPIDCFYTDETATSVLREREQLDMTAYLKEDAKKRLEKSDLSPMLPATPRQGYGGGGGGGFAGGEQYQVLMRGATNAAIAPLPAPMEPMRAAAPKAMMHKSRMAYSEPTGTDASAEIAPPPGMQPETVQLRSNFDALAKWAPSVVTDANGHAVIKFKLPDNLTKYRIMAVANHGADQFGMGESSLTVRLPLMVKPAPPRFLNFGDKFELPVVLQNQTDSPVEVNVAARATNADFTKGQGRHTTIPANDRVEIRFPASTAHSGTAKFQVIAAAGTVTDASQFDLPVYTPATTEAFATYGQIDQGAILQTVQTPADVIPDFGALELSTSTTVLETITDAFLYLEHYPFSCSEQIASQLISVALLKDMLQAFHVKGLPTEIEVQNSVKDSLQKLQSRQKPNGSFALWSSNDRKTYPYVTLHVTHALLLIQAAGYDVPKPMLNRALSYVKSIDQYLTGYSDTAKTDAKALAFYIRNLDGDTDVAGARKLLAAQPMDKMSLESLAFLLDIFSHKNSSPADAAAIYSYLSNFVVETAGTAQIVRKTESINDNDDFSRFDSPMRANAILLDAFISEGKSTDLITKLLRTVMGGQRKGRWGNTQENVYVLLAIRHYFDRYEKTEPNVVAEAWLGKDFIGESSYKGRTNECKSISAPMSYLAERPATQELILKKTGEGRLYYRLAMHYAPKNLQLAAMDRGFNVSRTYEGATSKTDVSHGSDGRWHFKSGSLIKVKLRVSAPAERFFVALVDPLPAGAESLNEDLNGTEHVQTKSETSVEQGRGRGWGWGWWWHWNWWNHENKRDNQTEVFADQLQGGSHDYAYLMRATTPGTFVVPPTKAEEMYTPETFGRTQTETVVIE